MTTRPEWPPAKGLSTVIVSRENAILTSVASTIINAPASLVFDVVCETSKYPEWNTFVPQVTIHSQPEKTPSESTALVTGTSFTYHVIMDSSKPNKEQPTQLLVTDVSTPEKPSSYIPQDILANDGTYVEDLRSVYRISWKSEGGFVSRGLQTERFHEIIITGDDSCEVRTWEIMGGLLARTVKWFYAKTLMDKFELWCQELKKHSERAYNSTGR